MRQPVGARVEPGVAQRAVGGDHRRQLGRTRRLCLEQRRQPGLARIRPRRGVPVGQQPPALARRQQVVIAQRPPGIGRHRGVQRQPLRRQRRHPRGRERAGVVQPAAAVAVGGELQAEPPAALAPAGRYSGHQFGRIDDLHPQRPILRRDDLAQGRLALQQVARMAAVPAQQRQPLGHGRAVRRQALPQVDPQPQRQQRCEERAEAVLRIARIRPGMGQVDLGRAADAGEAGGIGGQQRRQVVRPAGRQRDRQHAAVGCGAGRRMRQVERHGMLQLRGPERLVPAQLGLAPTEPFGPLAVQDGQRAALPHRHFGRRQRPPFEGREAAEPDVARRGRHHQGVGRLRQHRAGRPAAGAIEHLQRGDAGEAAGVGDLGRAERVRVGAELQGAHQGRQPLGRLAPVQAAAGLGPAVGGEEAAPVRGLRLPPQGTALQRLDQRGEAAQRRVVALGVQAQRRLARGEVEPDLLQQLAGIDPLRHRVPGDGMAALAVDQRPGGGVGAGVARQRPVVVVGGQPARRSQQFGAEDGRVDDAEQAVERLAGQQRQ